MTKAIGKVTDLNSNGGTRSDVDPIDPARTHGPYRLVQLLGQGAIAQVFEAIDPASKRTVAIKLFRPEIAQSPQLSARLRAHAVGPPRIEHANVNPLLSVICDGEEIGIVYPIVHGYTLDREVQRAGPARLPRMIPQFVKILEAFEFAHSRRAFHLDIKPGNLVFPADAPAQVLDFSISRMLGISALTADLLGSLDYLSPEQLAGDELDGRADIFSLGAALYHLTTGELPFLPGTDRAEALANRQTAPRRPGLVVPSMPNRLEEIILKALASEPSERFQTVTAFKTALTTCSLGPPAVQAAPPAQVFKTNPPAAPLAKPVMKVPALAAAAPASKPAPLYKAPVLRPAPPPPAAGSGFLGWVALAIAIAAGAAATWTFSRERSAKAKSTDPVVIETPAAAPVEPAISKPSPRLSASIAPSVHSPVVPPAGRRTNLFVRPRVRSVPQGPVEVASIPIPSSTEALALPQSPAIPIAVPALPPPQDEKSGPSAAPVKAGPISPVRVTSTAQEARRLGGRLPVYPAVARGHGLTGTVRLRLTISAEGRVSSIVPLSGHVLLTRAAEDAIRTWTYSPTLIEGRAVPVVADVSVEFHGLGNPH